MNVNFALTLLRWRVAGFNIRIELDPCATLAAGPVINRSVKKMSRWWTGHLAS